MIEWCAFALVVFSVAVLICLHSQAADKHATTHQGDTA